jgi:hypothetical protein
LVHVFRNEEFEILNVLEPGFELCALGFDDELHRVLHLFQVLRLVCGDFGDEMVQRDELLIAGMELLLEKIELRAQEVLKVG